MAIVESERNLLFGILALQNGLVEQADLIAAFQCWSQERSRPMAQVMVERGALTQDDRAMLDGLVRRHVEKHGGDAESSRAAVPTPGAPAENLRKAGRPDRDVEDSLAHLSAGGNDDSPGPGNLTIGVGTAGDPDAPPDWNFSLGQMTSEGGRFRLLRHHARGGIGVVSVALDSELHREVALKQIQPRHADDPTSRARFLLEAEVTGRLEHPGVVPVYGLGKNTQGRPFYAMRFVRGQSLKEAIDRFHQADLPAVRDPAERALALRQLLRRFIDVCNAIAYAHSRGVLHRDLKPANILLGPYGETLVVDWGLAKVVGRDDPTPRAAAELTLRPASQSGSGDTIAGTAIGTPAYMSPEQAEGRMAQIGPASDVYSLGATLYCLVTGRPSLEDGDVEEMVRRVRRGAFPPPRQVNPRVPPALGAIVVKAMALRPDDRYPSARTLAEEVERWLADEPVSARPEPFWERARRWMRRRKSAVAALAATVLAATFGLAAVLAVQTRANAALKSANLELAEANRRTLQANNDLQSANARERARFDLALEAIKTFHGGVSEDLLLKEKQFDGLRTKLLRGATDFYERIEHLLAGQADRRSRAALGQAYHDIGELTAKIGSQSEALASLRRAMELRLAIAAEPGSGALEKLEAGRSLLAVGDLHEATGQVAAALESYERARGLLEPLAQHEADGATYRAAVAKCLHGIARVQYNTGHAAESLTSHEQARAIRQSLADANATVTQFQSDLAVSYQDIGAIQRAGGRTAEALASFHRALAIRQKLALVDPAATQFESEVAQSHDSIGFLLHETGHLGEALESLEQARTILQKLADANPAVTRFEGDLAQCHQVIGSIQDQTGHQAEALASYERAGAILQRLADANPTLTLFQNRLAMSHSYLGLARQRGGRTAEAAAEFRQSIAIMERLSGLQPDGYNLYNLACFRALLSGIAAQPNSGLTTADVSSLGKQAVEALQRAVAAGFRDFAYIRRDTDLDALRSRPDFQMLLMDLAFPEAVFAN
jgi:serine/threonine protein kinase/tetratricopeptide (TPR) repeat protein